LAIHLLVIGFNLFGLVAIPVGGWLGWRLVRRFWWRALHLASLGVVAVQALAGRACFLTIMQSTLTGDREAPMIMSFVNRLLYWPLPVWVFAALYLGIFLYALALWRWVPPSRSITAPALTGGR
jgi:hypothetical protein